MAEEFKIVEIDGVRYLEDEIPEDVKAKQPANKAASPQNKADSADNN